MSILIIHKRGMTEALLLCKTQYHFSESDQQLVHNWKISKIILRGVPSRTDYLMPLYAIYLVFFFFKTLEEYFYVAEKVFLKLIFGYLFCALLATPGRDHQTVANVAKKCFIHQICKLYISSWNCLKNFQWMNFTQALFLSPCNNSGIWM
jgi:hypothetical protein